MSTRSKSRPSHTEIGPEFELFTIGAERLSLLCDLITSARADLQPRNFPERHLVDELALSKWRTCRVALMQKAVYENQKSTFSPRAPRDSDGTLVMPHEDIYHLAMAHAPESHGVVLAALERLDARYHREFCTTLRLLIALRRGTPPPVAESSSAVPQSNATPNRKETTSCEPSPITPPAM